MSELSERERLRQVHFEILMLLGSIADAEKRLDKMKLEAQQLSCAVMDRIDEKQSDV